MNQVVNKDQIISNPLNFLKPLTPSALCLLSPDNPVENPSPCSFFSTHLPGFSPSAASPFSTLATGNRPDGRGPTTHYRSFRRLHWPLLTLRICSFCPQPPWVFSPPSIALFRPMVPPALNADDANCRCPVAI